MTPPTLDEVVHVMAPLVLPPLDAARQGQKFTAIWKPKGPGDGPRWYSIGLSTTVSTTSA